MRCFVMLCVLAFVFIGESVQAVVKQKQLRFEWDYEQPPEDIGGFRLYWAEVSGGPYIPLVDIHWREVSEELTLTKSIEAQDNATTIRYFVLTAYDTEGNESINSNEVFAIIDFEAPGQPYTLTITVLPIPKE